MQLVENKEITTEEFLADLEETLNDEEELLRRFHDGETLTPLELKRVQRIEQEIALELARALHEDIEIPKKPRQ